MKTKLRNFLLGALLAAALIAPGSAASPFPHAAAQHNAARR